MMRHPRADDDRLRLALGCFFGISIVASFIKSVFANPTCFSKRSQISQRGFSIERHGEETGIGRNDRAVVSARGKRQGRNAEGMVLIVPVLIPGTISRLRDSPGNMERIRMGALSRDSPAQGGIKHGV